MPEFTTLAAVAGMAVVAVTARLVLRTWLHPGSFFALGWLFVVVFSLSGPLVGVEQYRVWHGALWFMALAGSCVFVGSMLGVRLAGVPARPSPLPVSGRELPNVVPVLAVCAFGSIVFPIAEAASVPVGQNPPPAMQVLLGFHFIGAPIAGVLFAATRETRYRVLSVAVLIVGMFLGLMETSRTKIVFQFCHWFAGYFTMLVFMHRGRTIPLFSPGRVGGAVISLTVFLVVAVVFNSFRAVPLNTPPGEKLRGYSELLVADRTIGSWEYMQSGIFGQVAMFSVYFEMVWSHPPKMLPGLPQQTAAGIHRALGLEMPEALHIDIGGQDTNIFTTFKPAIEDFTIPGALLVFFAWGAISGWAYRRLQLGSLWPGGILIYYFSHAMNLGGTYLTYNSLTGAFLLVGAYLWYVETYRTRRSVTEASASGRVARVCWGS